MDLNYTSGIGNIHASEAIAGALPLTQNSPQNVKLDLFAEQITGSAFTAPRHLNLKSWVYRTAPSVVHDEFVKLDSYPITKDAFIEIDYPPTQLRWMPLDNIKPKTDFIKGLIPWCYNGSPKTHNGAQIYLYALNTSMEEEYFYSSDGEFLIVPQSGELHFATEFGDITVEPSEIIVIPRGIKFAVSISSKEAKGYAIENFGANFILPELGPIGANGLANPAHFLYPTAKFVKKSGNFKVVNKYHNNLWAANTKINPLNVVAWRGNYAPYKYDLKLFNTINTVSYDHPDPSIFTVLTSQTTRPGVANIDFVIFPPRWIVAENTFRPPYFHRNIMSEFMGLIYGEYDAKSKDFAPGGCSLHNTMTAHGPDAQSYQNALNIELVPERYVGTLAFMFESNLSWNVTKFALEAKNRDKNYLNAWKGLAVG